MFKCVQVFVIEINYCGNVIVTVDYFDDCVKNYKVRCFHGSSTLGLTRRTCNTCDCITIQYNTIQHTSFAQKSSGDLSSAAHKNKSSS